MSIFEKIKFPYMLNKIWNSIFVTTYYQIEKEKTSNYNLDKKVMGILFIVSFALLFNEYLGRESFLILIANIIDYNVPDSPLFYLAYWASMTIIFYLILPILFIKLIFKNKLSEYGLSAKGIFKSYKIYFLFFLFMVPLIFFVSASENFQNKYPFYSPFGESLYPNFIIWQFLYLLQFFSLEFFFRGFMLHGIKQRFGFYSIWVMMIPYMMIHFGKPMPETISAIFAGIILGALSLKSRSIWLGVAIHYSVAITMDLMSLWRKGYFD